MNLDVYITVLNDLVIVSLFNKHIPLGPGKFHVVVLVSKNKPLQAAGMSADNVRG